MASCGMPALMSIDDEEKPSIMVIWRRSDKNSRSKPMLSREYQLLQPWPRGHHAKPDWTPFSGRKKELQRRTSCQSACSNLGRVLGAEGLFRHPSWIQIAGHVAKAVRMEIESMSWMMRSRTLLAIGRNAIGRASFYVNWYNQGFFPSCGNFAQLMIF